METLTFVYHNKLRIVRPLAVKRGALGRALLVCETHSGKIKSFDMAQIYPTTPGQDAVLNGEVPIEF